jgi:hypothetical protein
VVPAVPGAAIIVAPVPRALARISAACVRGHSCAQCRHGMGLLSGKVQELIRGLHRATVGGLVVDEDRRPRIELALQNCSCDRTSFGGRAISSYFPFYMWHWQYARKIAYLKGHFASMNVRKCLC